MSDPDCRAVTHRRVFFLPGFDPFPARRYREAYRSEGARQAAVAGYELRVESRDRQGQWTVYFETQTQRVTTEFKVLDWTDLVHCELSRSRFQIIWDGFRAASVYLRSGAFFAMVRLRRGPALVSLFPYCILILWTALWFLAFTCVALLFWPASPLFALCLVGALILAEHLSFKVVDQRLYLTYLLADFAFWSRCRGAYPKGLSERFASWRKEVTAAARNGEEVLIVGHSSGALLAVGLLAGLDKRANPMPDLLTLGQTIPMVSLLPQATQLRRDLKDLAKVVTLCWVDVSAPGDPCCFALCDPVAVSGAGPADVPLILSAAFSLSLSEQTWSEIRWRFRRLHSQYLCAFDDPAWFDYFLTTAGPLKLSEVFAGRRPCSQRRYHSVLPKRSS